MLVLNNKPHIRDAYEMKLYPGVNDVDPAKWAEATVKYKDQEILALLDKGDLVVLEKDEVKMVAPEKETKTLKGFSKKKALEVIKDTFNYELLAFWKASDDRPDVIVAIEKRVEEMKAAAPQAKKKDK